MQFSEPAVLVLQMTNYKNKNSTILLLLIIESQSCPTLCKPMDYTVHGIL